MILLGKVLTSLGRSYEIVSHTEIFTDTRKVYDSVDSKWGQYLRTPNSRKLKELGCMQGTLDGRLVLSKSGD